MWSSTVSVKSPKVSASWSVGQVHKGLGHSSVGQVYKGLDQVYKGLRPFGQVSEDLDFSVSRSGLTRHRAGRWVPASPSTGTNTINDNT